MPWGFSQRPPQDLPLSGNADGGLSNAPTGKAPGWVRPSEALRQFAEAPVEQHFPQQATRIKSILADIANRRAKELGDLELTPENLEKIHGELEDQPSWNNAEELAQANKDKWWFDPSAKWTMHPARYRYMQDVGRDVDFLRGYLDSGGAADDLHTLNFWDRSNGAKATDSWDGANYQRFSGLGNQFASSVTDRAVPFAAFTQTMDAAGPNVLRWLLSGRTDLGGAIERTHALNEFQKRYRLGKDPVLDIPTPKEGDGPGWDWHDREALLKKQRHDLEPPSGHGVMNHWVGPVPAFVGDAVDTLLSAADPSLFASVLTSIPKRAVARAVMRARPPMRVPPVRARDVARAAGGQAVDELMPEAAFAAAVRAAAPSNGRTWPEYFLKPVMEESTPDHRSESAALHMLTPDQMSVPDVRTGRPVGAPNYRSSPIPATPWR